jgi:hypothetical protein
MKAHPVRYAVERTESTSRLGVGNDQGIKQGLQRPTVRNRYPGRLGSLSGKLVCETLPELSQPAQLRWPQALLEPRELTFEPEVIKRKMRNPSFPQLLVSHRRQGHDRLAIANTD